MEKGPSEESEGGGRRGAEGGRKGQKADPGGGGASRGREPQRALLPGRENGGGARNGRCWGRGAGQGCEEKTARAKGSDA